MSIELWWRLLSRLRKRRYYVSKRLLAQEKTLWRCSKTKGRCLKWFSCYELTQIKRVGRCDQHQLAFRSKDSSSKLKPAEDTKWMERGQKHCRSKECSQKSTHSNTKVCVKDINSQEIQLFANRCEFKVCTWHKKKYHHNLETPMHSTSDEKCHQSALSKTRG